MCIAILNTPNGGVISKETLQKCWSYNRDGAGFAYPENGKLIIFKELRKFNKFYKQYVAVRKALPEINIMLHFRIKTHGLITADNCHPFLVHEELAFCHNGMVDGFSDKEKSDTVLFMEKVLRNMPKNFIEFEGCRRLIRRSTGWSKFIFLTADNRYRIVNEEGGVWDGENWYSNTTYLPTTNYTDYGGKRVYTQGTQQSLPITQVSTYWQSKYGTGTFHENGLPKETKDVNKWPEKEYGNYDYNDSSVHDTESEDDLPFKVAKKEQRCCSECYTPLAGRMENHYGVCTKCLKEYEIIPS